MIRFSLGTLIAWKLWVSIWLALNFVPWSMYTLPTPVTELRVIGWPWPFYIVSYRVFDVLEGEDIDFYSVPNIDHYCASSSEGDNLGVPYKLNAVKDLGLFVVVSTIFTIILLRIRNRPEQKLSPSEL